MNTYSLYQSYCLQDMYNTGCRYNELYERDRISNYDVDNYKIITEKGSTPRIILKSSFTQFFKDNLTTLDTSFTYCRKSTMQLIIRRFLTYKHVMVGNKGVSTHLFRYNYIRKKHDAGMSYSDIAALIGEVDVQNIVNYCGNDINGN